MIQTACFFLLLVGTVYCQNEYSPCSKGRNKLGVYYRRLPTNCSLYDVCVGNIRLATMACGEELVFSKAVSNCVRVNGLYDDCEEDDIPGGVYNDPLCKPNPNGLNVDPSNCSRYIPCYNMTSKPVMKCQENLYFNFMEQRCMGKDKVKCEENKKSSSTADYQTL